MTKDRCLTDVVELAGVDTPRDRDLMNELGWDAGQVFELMEGLYDKDYFGDEFLDEWEFWESHPGLFETGRLTLNDIVEYISYL